MAYSAETVAKSFLELAFQDGQSVDPLKLMKLVYFAHGFYLASAEEPLISENIKAWKYGPVVPSLYHRFKKYGRTAIPFQEAQLIPAEIPQSDEWAREVISTTWNRFKNESGFVLSLKSHAEGSPWEKIWDPSGSISSITIPNDEIKKYFQGE